MLCKICQNEAGCLLLSARYKTQSVNFPTCDSFSQSPWCAKWRTCNEYKTSPHMKCIVDCRFYSWSRNMSSGKHSCIKVIYQMYRLISWSSWFTLPHPGGPFNKLCMLSGFIRFFNIGFLCQFRQMSSQFNHQAILLRAKSNATPKGSSISFYDLSNVMLRHSI